MDSHHDLRTVLKKKLRSGSASPPSAGSTQAVDAKEQLRRRLSRGEKRNAEETGHEEEEEGAVAEYIRGFKNHHPNSMISSMSPSSATSPTLPSLAHIARVDGEDANMGTPALPPLHSLPIAFQLPSFGESSGSSQQQQQQQQQQQRLLSPLNLTALRSGSSPPTASPSPMTVSPYAPHSTISPSFFAPSPTPGGVPQPSTMTTDPTAAILMSHLQEKEQEVENLTTQLKFLRSHLAATPSPSSSMFTSSHHTIYYSPFSPSPFSSSPFSPSPAYMLSSPSPFQSCSPSPPLPSYSPIGGVSAYVNANSPLSARPHSLSRQYFAPIIDEHHPYVQQQPPPPSVPTPQRGQAPSREQDPTTRESPGSPSPSSEHVFSKFSPVPSNCTTTSPTNGDSPVDPFSPILTSKLVKKEAIPLVMQW